MDGDKPGWQFNPENTAPSSHAYNTVEDASPQRPEPVEWTASEYVAHHKSIGWFMALGAATAVLSIIVYLITRGDMVSSGMIVLAGIAFGIFGARQPEVLQYNVSDSGIRIGQKFYGYGEFKSFSILNEGAFNSIMLLPLKRFMPPISIYYVPEDEEKIIHNLSTALPVEDRQEDRLDRLMRRLRF